MAEAGDFQELRSLLIVNSVFNAFLSFTAIMLNIITIHALRKTSSLPKPLKTLFLSLTVSDLLVGLLVQPLYVSVRCLVVTSKPENTEQNLTWKITNNVLNVTSTFLCYALFFSVTALAADRFLAIHLHLRYRELVTHRRVVVVVISIWALSAIISPLWLWKPKIYSTVTGIIVTACLILTALFYCKIYLAVRRHTNQIHARQVQQVAQNDQDEVVTNTARQIKSAIGTLYVYLVFLVCYLPHISINVVHAIAGPSTQIDTAWEYTLTLVYLNSSFNPLVYCWKMRHIRQAIMNILRNMFSCTTTN